MYTLNGIQATKEANQAQNHYQWTHSALFTSSVLSALSEPGTHVPFFFRL